MLRPFGVTNEADIALRFTEREALLTHMHIYRVYSVGPEVTILYARCSLDITPAL